MVEMLIGYTLVFLGIGLLAEGWREVHRAHREQRLATDGLYGIVRHPQYTGIFIAIFGQLVHWPTIPTLVLCPLIVLAYYRLGRREEQAMRARFGEEYRTCRTDAMRRPPKRRCPRARWRMAERSGRTLRCRRTGHRSGVNRDPM